MSKLMKFTLLGFLSGSRLFQVPCTSFSSLAALPAVVLVSAVFGTKRYSSESMRLTVVINTPQETVSLWNLLMILPHGGWDENMLSSMILLWCEEMCVAVVGYANLTMCLFPLSPQGAKARRSTSMKRGNGCGGCSNKLDESSVLVRYSLFLVLVFSLSGLVSFTLSLV